MCGGWEAASSWTLEVRACVSDNESIAGKNRHCHIDSLSLSHSRSLIVRSKMDRALPWRATPDDASATPRRSSLGLTGKPATQDPGSRNTLARHAMPRSGGTAVAPARRAGNFLYPRRRKFGIYFLYLM